MTENKGILRSDMFYIDHLDPNSSKDIQAIDSFTVDAPEGQGLSAYLKEYACAEELDRSMRTYLVRDIATDECVGYFSLKAGLISLNEVETEDGILFDTLPGTELANFAVNNEYLIKNPTFKGIGFVIFNDFIKPLVEEISKTVGVKIIYIFALPFEGLIKQYGRYGFRRLEAEHEAELHRRLKPRYDSECIFMYQML